MCKYRTNKSMNRACVALQERCMQKIEDVMPRLSDHDALDRARLGSFLLTVANH